MSRTAKGVIEELIEKFNLPIKICKVCGGDGEIIVFCGHDVAEYCLKCKGKGYIPTKEK